MHFALKTAAFHGEVPGKQLKNSCSSAVCRALCPGPNRHLVGCFPAVFKVRRFGASLGGHTDHKHCKVLGLGILLAYPRDS